eukprot:3911625-Pleurochrysis_carterae.AAC.1
MASHESQQKAGSMKWTAKIMRLRSLWQVNYENGVHSPTRQRRPLPAEGALQEPRFHRGRSLIARPELDRSGRQI